MAPGRRSRALFAGMTDYTGVSIDVILSHLRNWRANTLECIASLSRLRTQAEENNEKLDEPKAILGYIDYFIDLFDRYASDFGRLLSELPHGVREAHVQIVQQIYESSRLEEGQCIRFTDDHIERTLKDEGLRWLVDRVYAESRGMIVDYLDLSNVVSRLRTFVGIEASKQAGGYDPDRHFAMMAIEEALKSVPEDETPRPKVGAVVVKDGTVLSKAHRGETPECHAEYIALDKKLSDHLVAGATVYTTLEPCTTRKHPKIPCAQRLVDRKVGRVVIGMLDPNPKIRGLGEQLLNEAGIETQLFPRDLRSQVEEMNRDFTRAQKQRQATQETEAAVSGLYVELYEPTFIAPKVGDLAFKLLQGKYVASGKKEEEATTDCDLLVELYIVNKSGKKIYIRDFMAWIEIGGAWQGLAPDESFDLDDLWSGFVQYGLEVEDGSDGWPQEPEELPRLLIKRGAELQPGEPIEGWLRFTVKDVNPNLKYPLRIAVIDSLGNEHHIDKAVAKERRIAYRRVKR